MSFNNTEALLKEKLKEVKPLHIIAMLAQKTGKEKYQLLLNSILGMCPEKIDSIVLRGRVRSFDKNA